MKLIKLVQAVIWCDPTAVAVHRIFSQGCNMLPVLSFSLHQTFIRCRFPIHVPVQQILALCDELAGVNFRELTVHVHRLRSI